MIESAQCSSKHPINPEIIIRTAGMVFKGSLVSLVSYLVFCIQDYIKRIQSLEYH